MADINLAGMRGAQLSQLGRQADQEFKEWMAGDKARALNREVAMAFNQQLIDQAKLRKEREGDRKRAYNEALEQQKETFRLQKLARELEPLVRRAGVDAEAGTKAIEAFKEGNKVVDVQFDNKTGRPIRYFVTGPGIQGVQQVTPEEIVSRAANIGQTLSQLGSAQATRNQTAQERADKLAKERREQEEKLLKLRQEGENLLQERVNSLVNQLQGSLNTRTVKGADENGNEVEYKEYQDPETGAWSSNVSEVNQKLRQRATQILGPARDAFNKTGTVPGESELDSLVQQHLVHQKDLVNKAAAARKSSIQKELQRALRSSAAAGGVPNVKAAPTASEIFMGSLREELGKSFDQAAPTRQKIVDMLNYQPTNEGAQYPGIPTRSGRSLF